MPKKGIAALNKKRKSKFNEMQSVQQVLQSGLNSGIQRQCIQQLVPVGSSGQL